MSMRIRIENFILWLGRTQWGTPIALMLYAILPQVKNRNMIRVRKRAFYIRGPRWKWAFALSSSDQPGWQRHGPLIIMRYRIAGRSGPWGYIYHGRYESKRAFDRRIKWIW
jgi:hypothetical protein